MFRVLYVKRPVSMALLLIILLIPCAIHLFHQTVASAELEKSKPPTVYLTFDDGPSTTTDLVLDVLRQQQVSATFFVVGATTDHGKMVYQRILHEGHEIGLHSYSHNFDEIYASSAAFLKDFNRLADWIYQTTGVVPKICRMPGGSFTCSKKIREQIFAYFKQNGYACYNWDIDPKDSVGRVLTPQQLYQNIITQAKKKPDQNLIVLMHDNTNHKSLPDALPEIIQYFKQQGYTFDVLDGNESVLSEVIAVQ